jgi:CHAT domain-containing protein
VKTAKILSCCLLLVPLAGTLRDPVPRSGAPTPAGQGLAARAKLRSLIQQGNELFQSDQYVGAQELFELARQSALAAGDIAELGRATGDVGGCQFALHQYRPALASFLEARRRAFQAGDPGVIASDDSNIASLYHQMGDLETAVLWMQGALGPLERLTGPDRAMLPRLEIQMASLRARQGRMAEALELFRRGIDHADRAGDLEFSAFGWNRLGEELLRRGDLRGAEPPLLEAYRIRKLNHFALDFSYWNLGRLRLEQGDLESAATLLDLALQLGLRRQGAESLKDIYADRGRVRLALGQLPEALEDARIAVRLARIWRAEPPDDATRIGSERIVDEIHATLIEAGNRLYLKTGDPALIRETFEAVEEHRASSLRALARRSSQPESLSPAYWEASARLQAAELAALRDAGPLTRDSALAARLEFNRLEAEIDPVSLPPFDKLFDRVQAALDQDTVLLSFAVDDSASWLWAVDRSGIAVYALPPRAEIASQVQAVLASIRQDSDQVVPAGARLYSTLFGPLALRFRSRKHWLLACDETLAEVPLAALIERTHPQPAYLVEDHTTTTIPGAGFWLEAAARTSRVPSSHLFVGIGDPIYNSADSRLARPSLLAASWAILPLPAPSGPGTPLVLPRLVASGAELAGCARAWNGERALLEGYDASGRNLADQLRRDPAVLHFATHVLEAADGRHSGLIALSLLDGREPELLAPEQIAAWRIHAGLVVLSGCHSAAGDVLPGTGLLGLTRAWLTAGARTVVASRWPTPDESGPLFDAFYRNLGPEHSSGPGEALRTAQVQMIRNGGWRARPRYWAAYFAVGSK